MPPRTFTAVPAESIAQSILVVRGQKVVLDAELASLYGVSVKRFNEQVRRNRARFPADFMFELSTDEWQSLRSHFATLDSGQGKHRKYRPYAFTEHGAIMAASVLNSSRAVEMSVYVVRAFVRLREVLTHNRALLRRFEELEIRLTKKLTEHDEAIGTILAAIRELMQAPKSEQRGIGFTADLKRKE